MDIIVNEFERVDNIGFGNLRLIQKPEDFCYGVDAVILAEFAVRNSSSHKKIMDLGTGTGIIPLILSHKTDSRCIRGLEVQEDSWQRAQRNIGINGLDDRLEFICANVKGYNSEGEKYTLVTANPPYFQVGNSLESHKNAKRIARHEIEGTLEDFIRCAAEILENRGDFCMVHRPSRLVDICCLCRQYRLEPKNICMVSSHKGEKPNQILIHCVKNGGRELKFDTPLFIYGSDGAYSEEINRIYERDT